MKYLTIGAVGSPNISTSGPNCNWFLLLLLFFTLGFAAAAQTQSDPSLPDSHNLDNIEFRNDIRIFAVMAALNAAGFDYETAGSEMSPIRRKIRTHLEGLDTILLQQLRSFFRNHRVEGNESKQQAAYISLALLLSDPDTLILELEATEIPEDVWQIRRFEPLVRAIHGAANIKSLWNTYESTYSRELASYRPVMQEVVRQTLSYFKTPQRVTLDRQIILIPDLLNASNVVNARNFENMYYIVVGPTDNPFNNHRQLQHEYLHFLIDPLVEKFGAILLRQDSLLTLAQSQPNLDKQFQNKFLLIVTESLIESILLRLHPPQDLDGEFVRLFREGFILTPHFHRGLADYEKNDLISLPVYMETLFQSITPTIVERDRNNVVGLEKVKKQLAADALAAHQSALEESQRKDRIHSLLREAGILLSQAEHNQAKEKLRKLLELDPDNGNAFFYLAQIASQQQQFEEAAKYYDRAAQSEDTEAWIRAWSRLRLGKYLAFGRQFGKARSHFDAVLKMEGDLQGAREEAQESINQLRQQQ